MHMCISVLICFARGRTCCASPAWRTSRPTWTSPRSAARPSRPVRPPVHTHIQRLCYVRPFVRSRAREPMVPQPRSRPTVRRRKVSSCRRSASRRD
jgi:hypothetical protein